MNNNIKDSNTNIWGPSAWKFLHTVTFNYPTNPTNYDKEVYKNFFKNLGLILPCGICQYNYNIHLDKYPIDKYLSTKEDIVKWLIIIHNEVNKLHNKPTKTFEEIINYYTALYNNDNINNNKNKNSDYIFLISLFICIGLIIIYALYKKNIKYI
jgi:hypothetical protein